MILPTIKSLSQKTLVGMSKEMNLAKDETFALFSKFMPLKKEIKNTVNDDVLDLQIYSTNYFQNFNPLNTFVKWAAVEVSTTEDLPKGMMSLTLPSGNYAVFEQKMSAYDASIYEYIFMKWIPSSEFNLDDRPHFDVLNKEIQNRNPEAMQEIWIPIKEKV